MKNIEEKDEGCGKRNERGERKDEEWKSSLFFCAKNYLVPVWISDRYYSVTFSTGCSDRY